MNKKILMIVSVLAAVLMATPLFGSAQALTWQREVWGPAPFVLPTVGALVGVTPTTEWYKIDTTEPWYEGMMIIWNPLRNFGRIIDFGYSDSAGYSFNGWMGYIVATPFGYRFRIGGACLGNVMTSRAWVYGYLYGTYIPDDPNDPFASGVFDEDSYCWTWMYAVP